MSFTSTLISWYEAHKRDLPFRGTKDPYLIWISEVILQQTRMEQGIGYYLRFIKRYPDIASLAEASEEEVLKEWQGMGYYSRARNLHASAREIVDNLGGIFPGTYAEILKLKGIGDYSAASIASLAFDEPHAAVDGNVFRFLSRQFGFRDEMGSASGKKRIREKAESLLDQHQPGTFNQAMIEFGALVCTPQNPSCQDCVFRGSCFAFMNSLIHEIPNRIKSIKPRIRYFHYLVITRERREGTRFTVKKREDDDIWQNLYDFPVIEAPSRLTMAQLMKTRQWKSVFSESKPRLTHVSEEFKHILSHQVILAIFYRFSAENPPDKRFKHIEIECLDSIPLPKLISRYLQKYFL